MKPIVVCALYKFAFLEDPEMLRQPLLDLMHGLGILGTLLLAREGINGTVAGSGEAIDALLVRLRSDPRMADIDAKFSRHDTNPFFRAKVRLKREIVTLGVEGIDPRSSAGTYVEPSDWNELISDPATVVIDTRNDYETAIGSFRNAIDPHTRSFRDFPRYVAENLDPACHRKVAMFCTGGIRCEKSTAYLKKLGFDEVYHLKGGILGYLEEIPEEESLWEGECFVFDQRVALGHMLEKGCHELCHGCRRPIGPKDRASELYQPGVSCPRCHGETSAERKERLRERERQVRLAGERGEAHLGAAGGAVGEGRRQRKRLRAAQASARKTP